ncbi:hypothetical protein SK128_006439 [Halocaridina rubra]|uniref:Uncharacterized protein n=1 Tax=Halocaridina rubra TaxID=373956 RepID=A0AAN8X8F7_HALRR
MNGTRIANNGIPSEWFLRQQKWKNLGKRELNPGFRGENPATGEVFPATGEVFRATGRANSHWGSKFSY